MSSIPDPIRLGLARGWKVLGGAHGALPATLECDVVIVGSGAGAGVSAELLAKAGLKLVIVEEGPLKSSSDFRQREAEAYATLYQESAGRKTADKAMNILQGRCVGGSTTINWTSSFRTPPGTLAFWGERFGLSDLNEAAMAPWFEQVERRLLIEPWAVEPNPNNQVLRRGAMQLGIAAHTMRRNVKGCWNLGSCGMGCPTNAKQSMLLTTIPVALDLGATLLVQTQARAFEFSGNQCAALLCQPVHLNGAASGAPLRIKARHYVVAGGAINSPALLLRSQAPDPYALLGTRTFLHPTAASSAQMDERIEGWDGAPQSVYSDHYLHQHAIDGPLGYKLEVPPIHPGFAETNLGGIGSALIDRLPQLPHTQIMLALLRDGFHPQSSGGKVSLSSDGSPVLDYPLTPVVLEAVRRAHLSMAELQFAAGAKSVRPVHELAMDYASWPQARAAIGQLDYRPYLTRVGSAHVMGGCAMGIDASRGVVRPDGRHWQLANLSVIDGSIFPTSLGANPQLSIYAQANRLATGLAGQLAGKRVQLD
jgi:choline dehydrogenase-like flavoprotein